MRNLLPALGVLLCTVAMTCAAPPTDPGAPAAAIQAWRGMRFGMFIHWGPVSLTGKEVSWSRGSGTPIDVYDQLYKRFNPEEFNADEWVAIAKAAGMKYIVLTTKHHDGFCLWPTKYNHYNISETPFKRDVVGELAAACRKAGIAFGAYYSVADWHNPDFPVTSPRGRVKNPHPNLPAYSEYLRNQVTELIKNYGPLTTIWFDVPAHMTADQAGITVATIRKLQPDILINNRIGGGYHGDYDTPEQKVGKFQRNRPWESCMTISGHNHWAWGGDKDGVKSVQRCIKMIVQCIGGDGNILLNVGPRPDGRIDPAQAACLREVGEWVHKYAEGIYETRGGPFEPGPWGASTCKANRVWVFITDWPKGGGPLLLPKIDAKITAARTLSGGNASVQQTDAGVSVTLDVKNRAPIATVIELSLNRDAFDVTPVAAAPHQ